MMTFSWFALLQPMQYILPRMNPQSNSLRCDGCGQVASPEHTARRLQRLEWTTRYRPVHIHTLLLGGFSPPEEHDFLYSPRGEFHGQAALLLGALGISTAGKKPDTVQAEFQRAGYFLTHVLECPFEVENGGTSTGSSLLTGRLPLVAARIRRSLRPKRVILVTHELEPIAERILGLELGCPVLADAGKPFELDDDALRKTAGRLQDALRSQAGS